MYDPVSLFNTWKCIAEASLSGNYTGAPCYLVPPDALDALLTLAKFIAEWLGY